MATTAIRRLRMTRLDVDVVLGGGIFRNDDAPSSTGSETASPRGGPRGDVTVLSDPPVDRGRQLGLDRVGAHDERRTSRAGAALTHERLAAHTHRAQKE